MDSHTVRLLEFQSVLDELCEYCFSQQGREYLRTQEILPDADRVGELLNQAVEYRRILESGGDLPDPDFPDLSAFLSLLEKTGTVLEAKDLLFFK